MIDLTLSMLQTLTVPTASLREVKRQGQQVPWSDTVHVWLDDGSLLAVVKPVTAGSAVHLPW
jgi:hypothetical protein